jgi:TonB family protein
MRKDIKSSILNLAEILENKFQNKGRIAMISNHKSFSRKKTVVAFAFLISIGFISFTLSCVSELKQVPTEKRVYTLNDVDTFPSVIHSVPPTYPFEAAQKGTEGKVTVQFVVTKEGTVRDPIIFESSPVDVFDQAAIEAVTRYTFKPGTKGGETVDAIVRLPLVFQLTRGYANEIGEVSSKGEPRNGETNDDQEVVCRTITFTGTRIKRTVCTKKAEWKALDKKNREKTDEFFDEVSDQSALQIPSGVDAMGGQTSGPPH